MVAFGMGGQTAVYAIEVANAEGTCMAQPPDTFKKNPKRKTSRGKHVAVSADTKKAYEALIQEKEEREKRERHLPPDMQRR